MHFGAQSRGLRAPSERFAPWVSPGPRSTRFRLAADLGRMGLDTHRVSNKVSTITSRHLVPLDRAFPAHALVRESKLARTGSNTQVRHRPIANDSGRPSSVLRLSTLHASTDSSSCAARVRPRSRSPRIDLYRKKAFSTRAWRWYPASFFHRRRPIFVTVRIVRSRALERGRRRDSLAVFAGPRPSRHARSRRRRRRWCRRLGPPSRWPHCRRLSPSA